MSGSAQGSGDMSKKQLAEDSHAGEKSVKEETKSKPAPAALEEDDEFEDFPVEGALDASCLLLEVEKESRE